MFKMCKFTQNASILLCSGELIADFEKCQHFPAGIYLFKTARTNKDTRTTSQKLH